MAYHPPTSLCHAVSCSIRNTTSRLNKPLQLSANNRRAPPPQQQQAWKLFTSASSRIGLTRGSRAEVRFKYTTTNQGFREPLDTSDWKPKVNSRWTPMTIVLVSVPILTFALGTWQVQRLSWKKNLIRDLEMKMNLEPIKLPKHINTKVIPEFEYRKVKLIGRFDHSKEILIESKTFESELGYHLITPFYRLDGGEPVLVNRGFIKREFKNPRSRPESLVSENSSEVEVIGMLRKQEKKSIFQPNNSKELNQWYFMEIQEIAQHLGTAPILVDAITYANSGKLNQMLSHGIPIGRSPQISLRNMHATYIATWYGLSAITSVMSIILLRKPMSGKSKFAGIS